MGSMAGPAQCGEPLKVKRPKEYFAPFGFPRASDRARNRRIREGDYDHEQDYEHEGVRG